MTITVVELYSGRMILKLQWFIFLERIMLSYSPSSSTFSNILYYYKWNKTIEHNLKENLWSAEETVVSIDLIMNLGSFKE